MFQSCRCRPVEVAASLSILLLLGLTFSKLGAPPRAILLSQQGLGTVVLSAPSNWSREPITTNNSPSNLDSFFLSRPRSDGVDVVLNAKYRSGSSFTGEFFNQHGDFVYFFEPLHNRRGGAFVNDTRDVTHILGGLLNCTATAQDITSSKSGSTWKIAVLCGLGE